MRRKHPDRLEAAMNTDILSALIGAAGTVLAAVLSVVLWRLLGRRNRGGDQDDEEAPRQEH